MSNFCSFPIIFSLSFSLIGALDCGLYATYFSKGCCNNGYFALSVILFLTIVTQALSVFSDWWLAEWSRETAKYKLMHNTTDTMDQTYWQWSYVAWLPGITLSALLRSGILYVENPLLLSSL